MATTETTPTAEHTEDAIRLEGVSKQFPGLLAVDDVTLSIRGGEFFSLLGPSGCGKTTTLRMLAGFEQPTSGRIMLEGEPVEKMPPYERNVNMVFQSYALFEHLDVADNVAFGLKRRQVAKDEIERRVGEALGLVQNEPARRRAPQRAVGRPEAARGAGARARQPTGGAAARRAAGRARPEASAPDAGGAQGDPARGRASRSST